MKEDRKDIVKSGNKKVVNTSDTSKTPRKRRTEHAQKKPNAPKVPSNSKEYIEQMVEKRKRTIKISIIAIVAIVLFLLLFTGFAFTSMTNSKIIKGITIDGIDVSGLNKEEAYKLIEKSVKERQEATILLKYKEYTKEFPMEQLEIEANIQEAVDKAVSTGRNGNIFQNNFEVIKRKFKKEDIDLAVNLNEENLDKFLTDTNLELPGVVKEYAYSVEEEELIITKGTDGIILNKEKMEKDIKESITNISKSFPKEKEIEVKDQKAKEIDIDDIYNQVHTEPQDAYIVEDPFQVVVDKDGIDFAITMDEIKNLLKEDKEEYIIPLKVTKAGITVADLGSRAFPDVLATFTTRYDAGNSNRSTNLAIACKKINNYVLQPGETFSYNQTVGKRSIENGFREAHIFTSSGVEDGLGGGICQISSTLYNTVVLANLDIVERHNHSYGAGYVDPGRDATVSYGALDFKFKNPRKYPVKITAYINGGVATVSISGIKEENEPRVSIVATTTATIPCPVNTIEDPNMEEGRQEVTTAGMNGYRSVTYKYLYYPDGRVDKVQLSTDTYATITKVVRVGTKKAVAPVVTPTPTPSIPVVEPTPSEEPTPTPTEPTPTPSIPVVEPTPPEQTNP